MQESKKLKTTEQGFSQEAEQKGWGFYKKGFIKAINNLDIEDKGFEEKLKEIVAFIQNICETAKLNQTTKNALEIILEVIENKDEETWKKLFSLSQEAPKPKRKTRKEMETKKLIRDVVYVFRPLYEKIKEREMIKELEGIDEEIKSITDKISAIDAVGGEFSADRTEVELREKQAKEEFNSYLDSLEKEYRESYENILRALVKVKNSEKVRGFPEPENYKDWERFCDLVRTELKTELEKVQSKEEPPEEAQEELTGEKKKFFDNLEEFFNYKPSWEIDSSFSKFKKGILYYIPELSMESFSEEEKEKYIMWNDFFRDLEKIKIPFFQEVFDNLLKLNKLLLDLEEYKRNKEYLDKAETDFKAESMREKRMLESELKGLEDRKKALEKEWIKLREYEILEAGLYSDVLSDVIPFEDELLIQKVLSGIKSGEEIQLSENEQRQVYALETKLAEKIFEIQDRLNQQAAEVRGYILRKKWEDPRHLRPMSEVGQELVEFFNKIYEVFGKMVFRGREGVKKLEKFNKGSDVTRATAMIYEIKNNPGKFFGLLKRRWLYLPFNPYEAFFLSEALEIIKLNIVKEIVDKRRTEEYLVKTKEKYLEELEKVKPHMDRFIKTINQVLVERGGRKIEEINEIFTLDADVIYEVAARMEKDLDDMLKIVQTLKSLRDILLEKGLWNSVKKEVENMFPALKLSSQQEANGLIAVLKSIRDEIGYVWDIKNNLNSDIRKKGEEKEALIKQYRQFRAFKKVNKSDTVKKIMSKIEQETGEKTSSDWVYYVGGKPQLKYGFWKKVEEIKKLQQKNPNYEKQLLHKIEETQSDIEALKLRLSPLNIRLHYLTHQRNKIQSEIVRLTGKDFYRNFLRRKKEKEEEEKKKDKEIPSFRLEELRTIEPHSESLKLAINKIRSSIIEEYLTLNSLKDIEKGFNYLFLDNPNKTKKKIRKDFKEHTTLLPAKETEEAIKNLVLEFEDLFVAKINDLLADLLTEKEVKGADLIRLLSMIILFEKAHNSFEKIYQLRDELEDLFLKTAPASLPKLTAQQLLDVLILLDKIPLVETEQIKKQAKELLKASGKEIKFEHMVPLKSFRARYEQEKEREKAKIEAKKKKGEEKKKKEAVKTKRKRK